MGYQNYYATQISSDISDAVTTITVDTPPTVTSGRLALEARNPTKREIIEYTGVSGNDLTGVTRGVDGTTASSHLKGALVEMNLTAADIQDLYDAFNSFAAGTDWHSVPETIATITNLGNHKYDLVISSEDLTSYLSPGMRLRMERTVPTGDQCLDLELSSSQYASKTTPSGISFTTVFSAEAWVKLESYGSAMSIIVRRSASSNGFNFWINATGKVVIDAIRIASNYKSKMSSNAVPLGQWVHIAATLDLAANTSTIYINGIAETVVSNDVGTATSFTQAGDLKIGQDNNPYYFDGRISEVRLWDDVRTQSEIRDNMNQKLTGSETGLIGYWPLDGNFDDLTANNNDMTGQNGAVATTDDYPFAGVTTTTEYAEIVTSTFSTDTTLNVKTQPGWALPTSGGVGDIFYATVATPLDTPEPFRRTPSESLAPTVAFRGHYGGTVSASQSNLTDWVEEYDLGNNFNPTTGEFTVPYTGVYHLTCSLQVSNTTQRCMVWLFKTAGSVQIGCGFSTSTTANGDPVAVISMDVFLTAGEVVRPQGYREAGSGAAVWDASFFTGHLVGRV